MKKQTKKTVKKNSAKGRNSTKKSTTKKKPVKKNTNKRKKNQSKSSYEGTLRLIRVMLVIIFIMSIFMAAAYTFTSSEETIISKISSLSSKASDYNIPTDEEEQHLWDTLMEHFDYNEIPVLGIMCNIKVESQFKANNLETLNNINWDITDEDYTKKVNKGKILEDDFLEARYDGNTSGYYNSYGQWHNINGGYGYCQYTAYEKKRALYNYATDWFGKEGEGHGRAFNIADPRMQTSFIVHLLNNELSDIDYQLRYAETVEDAVYIWLSEYECPEGDYHEVTYERASYAGEIREFCTAGLNSEGDAE